MRGRGSAGRGGIVIAIGALVFLAPLVSGVDGVPDSVALLDAAGFKREVTDFAGVVVAEFVAQGCDACARLAPEVERAARALEGIVKVVAIDATVEAALARRFNVQSYPTIKLFGASKEAPTDYTGAHDAWSIAQAAMKAAHELVDARFSDGSLDGGADDRSARGGFAGSALVPLTSADFQTRVLDSDRPWLVAFYAPWSRQCARLAPDLKRAAALLGADFGIGAVDATVETALATRYDVSSYPTLKYFFRGEATDYTGARGPAGIEEFAFVKLEALGRHPEPVQLVSASAWRGACTLRDFALCLVAFLPRIDDGGARARAAYLDVMRTVARVATRRSPVAFVWAEAGSQPMLEESLGAVDAYPTVVAVSAEKAVFATMAAAFEAASVTAFVRGVISGRISTTPAGGPFELVNVEPWDGSDGAPSADDNMGK